MLKSLPERDVFIENNLGLVHSICKKFAGRGIEYDDLYQAGCIGLIKAADAFDTDRGLCFSTYAVPVIMGEVRRMFRDGGSVKVSRSVKELYLKVSSVKNKLEQVLNREPTVKEIAEKLGVSPEEVAESVCACQSTVSLTVDGDDGITEMDLPSKSLEEEITDRLILDDAFKILTDSEKEIMINRYYKSLTQSKTAEKLNMTQVQISRAEKKILSKLREVLK